MTFEIFEPPIAFGWMIPVCVLIGGTIGVVAFIKTKDDEVSFLFGAIVAILLVFGAFALWQFMVWNKVPAWDYRTELHKSDKNTTMVSIIEEDAPEAIITGASNGRVKNVSYEDTMYTKCSLEFSSPQENTVSGWVKCLEQDNDDVIITFGKE